MGFRPVACGHEKEGVIQQASVGVVQHHHSSMKIKIGVINIGLGLLLHKFVSGRGVYTPLWKGDGGVEAIEKVQSIQSGVQEMENEKLFGKTATAG